MHLNSRIIHCIYRKYAISFNRFWVHNEIKYKHRHQRCKAPSPQPPAIFYHEYLSIERSRSNEISFLQVPSYNVFSHSVFLTASFSQHLSQNVFLTPYFLQRLSHSVFLTPLPLHNHPHNVVITTSQYTRNLSLLYKYPKISQIRLSANPRNFAICW